MVKIRADILRSDLRRSQRLVEEGANRLHTVGARAMLSSLVEATPVDTGKAVSNWRVGIGQPTRVVIEAYSPGRRGSTAEANKAAALSAGLARIDTKKPGNEVFISNLVEYQEFIPRFDQIVDNAIRAGSMAVDSQGSIL